ncbi:hypothetical protein MPSEU_000914600 [Mayamaea pseudoterrestris]|nr:hypothetical protein MPSEU_000914600 [Mayamaea pseudoterrestris]
MNLPNHTEDDAKGLHPGAIFVGDSVGPASAICGKLNTDQAPSRTRVQQDATILFATTTDKKRAMANAKFLSECCMGGIPTSAATSAASEAQERFDKWWVQQCAPASEHGADNIRPIKRKRESEREEEPSGDFKQVFGLTEAAEGVSPPRIVQPDCVRTAKKAIKLELRRTGGDTTTPAFHQCVETLHQWYVTAETKAAGLSLMSLDGSWKSLNRPSFTECLGQNDSGDFMYTLGRIAFDAFRPTNLICSMKGNYNLIKPVNEYNMENSRRPRSIPHRLSTQSNAEDIRVYDTISLIQIEAGQTRSGSTPAPNSASTEGDYTIQQPIQARMTNHGFLLPDPEVKNRCTIHFTGGSLRPRDKNDLAVWREVFDPQLAPPYKIRELAHMLASNIYLGAATQAMQADGSLRYSFKRPIGGRGQAFIDVLYNDDDFLLIRGHHGSHFCFCR